MAATTSDIGILYSILEQVPEQYRELLHEYYLMGKSTEEIACELGIPSATVRSRLFLARKWLRAHRKEIITIQELFDEIISQSEKIVKSWGFNNTEFSTLNL